MEANGAVETLNPATNINGYIKPSTRSTFEKSSSLFLHSLYLLLTHGYCKISPVIIGLQYALFYHLMFIEEMVYDTGVIEAISPSEGSWILKIIHIIFLLTVLSIQSMFQSLQSIV